MNETHILVVDDEPEITELIGLYLNREGYHIHTADNGAEALDLARTLRPDLIILDIQMRIMNGIEVCQELRKSSDVPILFVSCKSDDTDIIHGLSIGGDDYITKPFSPKQLVARVNAHLRRLKLNSDSMNSIKAEGSDANTLLRNNGLVIDLDAHTVHVDGKPIAVSAKEFDLLTFLAKHPNKAFQLDLLYQTIWGTDSAGDTRTLMVHISNLRKKIEPDPANPTYIITVRGVGYKFNG
ncbi:response regulator [Paenibacillus tarimensis]